MKSKIGIIAVLAVVFALSGCGEYQQVQKSKDPEYKYQMALQYLNDRKYSRAQSLLEDVSSYYKGTERSQDVLIYLSRAYMGMKDYSSAAQYYQAYIRNYPKGKYIMEARYQVGHCYYLDSLDARLDQDKTYQSIKFFTEFVELYPDSPHTAQAYKELNEMYDKLAYKELLNAKLYYNLGTYLGNNYLSAELVAENALQDYPSNSYVEEFSWIILQAKYQQAVNSTEDKLHERARDAIDECYNFTTEFPSSKHINGTKKILKEMRAITKDID